MKRYFIIDRVNNNVIVYDDEIDFNYAIDDLVEDYIYGFNFKIVTKYYNNYSVAVIRLEK